MDVAVIMIQSKLDHAGRQWCARRGNGPQKQITPVRIANGNIGGELAFAIEEIDLRMRGC
ncbi:MAG: hypothetical protein BWY82_01819 [Verrucomicrobia bacterium ADurb.Bin474]|nr:MAG: hypothetical protein BWY82_01819 [Verrucomicrobia bacterium ADurb.Bin474]